jgi:nucleoside-diphosphate-sugar epimerase
MILVTGATGKNGLEIIKRLSGRQERIRAMVRKQVTTRNSHDCRAWILLKRISTTPQVCARL